MARAATATAAARRTAEHSRSSLPIARGCGRGRLYFSEQTRHDVIVEVRVALANEAATRALDLESAGLVERDRGRVARVDVQLDALDAHARRPLEGGVDQRSTDALAPMGGLHRHAERRD